MTGTLEFSWPDQDGNVVSSADLRGTAYVLYFYPKDDTSGCTKEACGIRDNWKTFQDAGLQVFGVSADDAESHQRFIAKFDLPFPLLTAPTDELERLGVWREKSMYGRTYMGINRETYLVGTDGHVLKHYPKVRPVEHADELLADFAALA